MTPGMCAFLGLQIELFNSARKVILWNSASREKIEGWRVVLFLSHVDIERGNNATGRLFWSRKGGFFSLPWEH